MSQPKRYRLPAAYDDIEFMIPSDGGDFVLHSDYAALAAENERLKAEVKHYIKERTVNSWSPTEKSCELILNEIKEIQIARLTAEVEWLRKAERLVCWNPATQAWEVRFEAPK